MPERFLLMNIHAICSGSGMSGLSVQKPQPLRFTADVILSRSVGVVVFVFLHICEKGENFGGCAALLT
jgi:hypothetical protein